MKEEEFIAAALLGAILEMSDAAQKLGGATSIAGVAALHKLQTSLQKNRPRIIEALQKARCTSQDHSPQS